MAKFGAGSPTILSIISIIPEIPSMCIPICDTIIPRLRWGVPKRARCGPVDL